jgi:hypothetical protein
MYAIMPIIYNREGGDKAIKKMKKNQEKNEMGLDKTETSCYNINMIRNNNTNEKRNEMSYYPAIVANEMKKGLSNELSMICEIGKVLRDLGNSRTEVNYYMSVDEDFISDVLGCYNIPKKRKTVSTNKNLNPWINHPKKT